MSRPKEQILKYELKTKKDELSNGSSVSLSDIPTSLHTFISSQKLPAFTRRGGRQAGVVSLGLPYSHGAILIAFP